MSSIFANAVMAKFYLQYRLCQTVVRVSIRFFEAVELPRMAIPWNAEFGKKITFLVKKLF